MATLSSDSIIHLRDYLSRRLDHAEVHEWLLSMEWNESASLDEKETLATLRAISLESGDDPHDLFDLDVVVMTLLKAVGSSATSDGSETDFASGLRVSWHIYSWNGSPIFTWEAKASDDAPLTPAMVSATTMALLAA